MVKTMQTVTRRAKFSLALAGSLLLSVVPATAATAPAIGSTVPAAGSADSHSGTATLAPTRTASVRFLVVPLKVTRGSIPSHAALAAMTRREVAWLRHASFGKVSVEGRIAPAFDARPYEFKFRQVSTDGLQAALDNAAAKGVPLKGAIPVYILSYPKSTDLSVGAPNGVQMRGQMWRVTGYVAHEVGHALGMLHAKTPQCGHPMRPASCRDHGPRVAEYGDPFDVMGFGPGAEQFGAFELGQLGWAPITNAPAGRAKIAIHPVNRKAPTLLRLRAADRDWYIETRTRAWNDNTGRYLRSPRGVLVSRVKPYSSAAFTDPDGLLGLQPSPFRIPANDRRFCGLNTACLDRFLYRPGSRLKVPGVFTVRVLSGHGAVRVKTRWLDHTPPTVRVVGATIHRFVGADPQLVVGLKASATGAGVLAVTVEQAGHITRISADDVTGIVDGASASGTVTVPLVAGAATARIRLIDAAGNVSAPADVSVAGLASQLHARAVFDPPISRSQAEAPVLPADGLTVSGTTDPGLAGTAWMVDNQSGGIIAPDGSFSGVIHPPFGGLYQVTVKVPIGRQPDGFNLTYEVFRGIVRT